MSYCKGDDCKGKKKRAKFNYTGLKHKYCGKCKLPDMINVVIPKCIACNDKVPSYNIPTESKALYCGDCKKPDMIDVKNPKCISCNNKQPNFNIPTESKGLYCNDCKLPDMINVGNIKCISCNLKQPLYNIPTESKGLYCGDCKKNGMINVISPKCISCNLIRPLYNIPTESKALYCSNCKKLDMINVVSSKCITESCEQFSQKDKYCWRCYYFHNPSKKPKRLKVKEEEVLNYLKQEFKDIEMITDKALIGDGLCLKNRPDVLIHLNKHSIIIEIDEEQHKYYNLICDEARINNIQEALDRPIIIIRFNPDAYIENGKKIKSCFNIDKKTGMRTIPKNQEQNWNNRLVKLKDTLAFSLEDYTDDPIRIIKLFYNNI
jgi:hypothetical protein